MIHSLGNKLSELSERYVPDPFVLALLLTGLTLILAAAFGPAVADLGLLERVRALSSGWYADFYGSAGLMKFALQMVIVLVTGHALALSRPVRAAISKFAGVAKTPGAAVVVVSLVACAASLIQWGLGAIAGAFMAREMGRAFAQKGVPVHYPLLGAAGYAGFLVWHGGFSGSAPLAVAGEDHFMVDTLGVIPVTETLLSPMNFVVIGTLIVLIPLLFWRLMPRDAAQMVTYPLDADRATDPTAGPDREPEGLVETLEHTRILNIVFGLLLVGALVDYFAEVGVAGWGLDSINLLFLTLGILLHRSPSSYVAAVVDGVKGAAGIILQFPFYFGILGLLEASGLIEQIAQFFVSISTADTFPIFTFLSAGLVNFFVPSGGGQWAVQGPVMMQAVETLGVPAEHAIMALAYGDAWTNMLQPFWALPLLGIMGLRAKDIIGYTAFVMLVTGPVMMLLLYLF